MSSLLDKSQTSNLKSQTSTICALATTPGGALGIIRISGPQTLEILSRIFSKDLTNAQPNTIHYGHIVEKTSNLKPHRRGVGKHIPRAPLVHGRRKCRDFMSWFALYSE